MAAMLRVRNWEKFQHYHKRNPPWIRLYNELLDNYEFACLPDSNKWQVIGIWLLASRFENKIPEDKVWIATRIGSTTVDVDVLISAGFIERYDDPASRTLASRKQLANPEGEGETEGEREKASKRRRVKWTFCPVDWVPSERHRLVARELGVDLPSAEIKFRNHEYDKPKSDADRAFDTWLRNTAEWSRNGNGRNGKPQQTQYHDLQGEML